MKSNLAPHDIEATLDCLDGSGSDREWAAAKSLRDCFGNDLPVHLLRRYQRERKWKNRSSLVYHATRYAPVSQEAVELGLLAAMDKSQVVRYRACLLIAYSQRRDLLPQLEQTASRIAIGSRTDLLAAMDAIAQGNPNYFVDRDHTGLTTLSIG